MPSLFIEVGTYSIVKSFHMCNECLNAVGLLSKVKSQTKLW